MRKKTSTIMCAVAAGLCIMLSGCAGSNKNPEIIMPEKPLQAAESTTNAPAKDNTGTDSGKPSGDNYKVYLITMDMTDNYWQSIDEGCKKAAAELGNVTYKWIGPDSHDDALQSACIDEAVANGANAILISANSANGVNDSLAKASDAGCKIVYVDSAASYDCVTALATDNEEAGRTAARSMKEALDAKGITGGTIGIIGVTEDTISCIAREKGFREEFEGTGFELADTVYMRDQAENIKEAVADGIASDYVAFFGTNEGTSVAIGEAVKDSGADVTVVSFDTSDTVLSFVDEGIIYATMQQNPSKMGYDGLTIAIGALKGTYTDTNTTTDTGVTVITKDTM